MRSLPAELVLRASHDRALRSPLRRTELGYATAGAALHELALTGRITAAPGGILVCGAERCPDRAVDLTLERLLLAERARGPRAWVERLGAELLDATRGDLVAGGLLVPVRRRVMGVVPVREYVPAGARERQGEGWRGQVLAELLDAVRHPCRGRPGPAATGPITDAVASAMKAATYRLAFPG
ncbi:GPP34 family phosphoprotein [Streptomyces sp. NPDC053755]|uniref:GOLPH3/VPS74 family protein n=1 Tax=Streptomyces sp. NPDC053755 TaxID=3155815 RepID=UPI00342CB3DC